MYIYSRCESTRRSITTRKYRIQNNTLKTLVTYKYSPLRKGGGDNGNDSRDDYLCLKSVKSCRVYKIDRYQPRNDSFISSPYTSKKNFQVFLFSQCMRLTCLNIRIASRVTRKSCSGSSSRLYVANWAENSSLGLSSRESRGCQGSIVKPIMREMSEIVETQRTTEDMMFDCDAFAMRCKPLFFLILASLSQSACTC